MAETIRTLSTLVKIAHRKVEDKQKEISKVEKVITQMNTREAYLLGAIDDETKASQRVGSDTFLYQQAGLFSARAQAELADIKEARADAQRIVDEKRAELKAFFLEEKRYDTLMKRRLAEEEKQRAKKRQQELDEIAGLRHRVPQSNSLF